MTRAKESLLDRLAVFFWIMNILLVCILATGWLFYTNSTVHAFFISPTPNASTSLASTPSQTPSVTSSPTSTPSPTPTFTPTFTSTNTPTDTPTLTPTFTPTNTPTPLAITFAVIGDFGMNNAAEADLAALIHSWQPDIIITVGDNNYPDGSAVTIDANIGKYFHDYIYPYTGSYGPGADVNRFFPSLGNHDYSPKGSIQPYLDYFTLPGNERYYDFTWGPIHFFALDSCLLEPDGIKVDSVQAAWLQQGLAASTSPWNIVYSHYPSYSSGSHGSTSWIQWPFASWGADAVLAGHDHDYERLVVDGIPYIVNGVGGAVRYYFRPTPLKESQFRFMTDYGAMRVTASETEMQFEFYNRAGELLDSSQVMKP